MSVKCEICSREFSKPQGLKVHARKCKATKVDNVLPKEKETVTEASTVQETGIIDTDKIERQIKKLLDTRKSTYDALTRHNIDLEIARLKEMLEV